MPIATTIAKRGFRKWYERELIRSHSHLVLLLFCAIAVMGALEAFSQPGGGQRLPMVVSLLVAAVVGVWAVRRYLFLLGRAELIANQATCPQCGTYARFGVESSSGGDDADARLDEGDSVSMQVCCRKCGHRWSIVW